jgi:hypothetical protein
MKIEQRISDRLDELIVDGETLLKTKWGGTTSGDGWVHIGEYFVDYTLAHQWGTSSLNLLNRVFGPTSDHYRLFNVLCKAIEKYDEATKALGVLKGANDDYCHDSLFNTRVLITAEVFDGFLEQAEHLLNADYLGPAAVVAGCVLEDGLRTLCQRNNIAISDTPKLDRMNADLAKANVYPVLVLKRITLLADLRNKAAHGKWQEFGKPDVAEMIGDVRRLLEQYLV